jgi:GT2 family glycosyltransferase
LLLNTGKPLTTLSLRLLWDSVVNDTRKAEEAVRMESPLLRRFFHRERISDDGIWGCYFSLPKALFYTINGCDEDFLDGSIEDNDLGIRVLNSGGKVKLVRSLAIVFHLWHQPSWGFSSEKYLHNKRILEKRVASRGKFCTNGITMRGQIGPGAP